MSNKKVIAVLGVIAVVVVVGVILYATNQAPKKAELAAEVNGVPISKADFERQIEAFRNSSGYAYDASEREDRVREIEQLALDQMIETELARQLALEVGIKVSDEDVAATYERFVALSGGEDGLAESLKAQGLSAAEYKEQVRTQMLIDAYIKQEIGTPAVSDQELRDEYEQSKQEYTDEDGTVRPFADVRDQIRNMRVTEKQTDAFNKKLDAFREESKIEVYVLKDGESTKGSEKK